MLKTVTLLRSSLSFRAAYSLDFSPENAIVSSKGKSFYHSESTLSSSSAFLNMKLALYRGLYPSSNMQSNSINVVASSSVISHIIMSCPDFDGYPNVFDELSSFSHPVVS